MESVKQVTKRKEFGRRLREFRLDKGMTQRQMGIAMGVSMSTILRAEAGRGLQPLTQRKIERFLESQKVAA